MSGYNTDTQAQAARLSTVPSATGPTKLFDLATDNLTGGNAIPSAVRGRSILNDSTALLTIVYGVAADLTGGKKTAIIAAGGYFRVDHSYVGPIYGQWVTANGNAQLTEAY
jgi:hypothetical protein